MTFETVADNLRESFRVVAAGRVAGEIRELPGVSIAAAGVAFQMFNAAFLSAPVASEAELEQRIHLSESHFRVRELEWAYWVCDDYMEGRTRRKSRQLFEHHGLRHAVELPGMVANSIVPPVRPLPGLVIRRVSDEASRAAFCSIGSICFHVPILWFREVFDNDFVWKHFAAYVAYQNGDPVSTAAIVMGGGAVGVYNVATVPDQQHRGYGEAVMRYAVAEAQREHGVERSILQSTPAGLHLYQRMGYRTITRVSVYAS